MRLNDLNLNTLFPITRFDQIGVAVRSVDRTAAFLEKCFGIEFLTFDMPRAEAFLRGRKVAFVARIGLARVGEIDLELMEILEGEHIVKEFLDKNGPGIHHLGIYVDDLVEAVVPWRDAGGRVVQETAHPEGIGTIYLDTEKETGGLYIELIKL